MILMKSRSILALTAFASAGLALGQPATTNPVGYTSQTLVQNTINLVGFNVLNPVLVVSTITAIGSVENPSLSDSNTNFSTFLTSGKMYTVEIVDGDAAGTVQEFNDWSENEIFVPVSIPGVSIGDKYTVRVCPTLQEIFPVGLLAGSSFATTADKVWVPNGPGSYTKYWYKTSNPVGWCITTTGSNNAGAVTNDIPLISTDGILVEKKGTTKEFVLTGEVKTTGSNVLLGTGLNLISINPPMGLTLFTSGLQDDIAGSSFASTADIVWVPTGAGSYTKYWYKTSNPVGWCITTTGSNNAGAVSLDVDLPPSVFIQRKSTPKSVSLNVPASYSNL
jgi:hypothetical protein